MYDAFGFEVESKEKIEDRFKAEQLNAELSLWRNHYSALAREYERLFDDLEAGKEVVLRFGKQTVKVVKTE